MRIALDARFLTHPQRGGFRTYTENLVHTLGRVDPQNDYVVYVDRECDEALPPLPHMTCVPVTGGQWSASVPWREQVELRRRISADRPDLVHFLCNTITLGLDIPHVVTLHDTIQLSRPKRSPRVGVASTRRWAATAYSSHVIRAGIPRAAHVIAPSEFVRREIARSLGVPLDRITAVHEAPAPRFHPLAPGKEARLRAELHAQFAIPERYVLAIGYEARKNIEVAIDAFSVVARTRTDVGLVIVSADAGGDRRRVFTARARDRGVDGRVAVLGPLGQEHVADLCAAAALFVFPSDAEGFGLPPLEAMACGVPTLALRASSIPEVVGDGAVLVDGLDPVVWAQAIEDLLANEARRLEVSRRGLTRACGFTWDRCARETLSVYEQVVAGDASRRVVEA